MANFTQQAIKAAFIELLEERPLREITVKDIVERCGINRNSFYYHFQDIPSLIEEMIREEADQTIREHPSVTSIVECFDALIAFASRRKNAIMHIYRSVSRELFEQRLMMLSAYFVQSYINTALAEDEINENDKKTIVDYYKCVIFGLAIEWLNTGMQADYIQSVRRIFLLKKDLAKEISDLLQGQI